MIRCHLSTLMGRDKLRIVDVSRRTGLNRSTVTALYEETSTRVDPRTESAYARGHYRDLLASFSGSQVLTGRHGAAEVGYIDPTVLSDDREERLLLLAGRSWRVIAVEWSKRLVWLEPAASGGRARWMGSARSLSREIAQGIRTVLANRAVTPTVTLSRRAEAAFESRVEEIPIPAGTHYVMTRSEDGSTQTWTFAGTRANRTLAREASGAGAKVRFDALSIQAPVSDLPTTLPAQLSLTEQEPTAFAKAIKFADCVPRALLSRAVIARSFESCSETPHRAP